MKKGKIINVAGRGLPRTFGRYSDLFERVLALKKDQAIELEGGEGADSLLQRLAMAARYHELNLHLPDGWRVGFSKKGDKVIVFLRADRRKEKR